MSKRESDDRDWSQASDSLFRASRADHEPTASDRARVQLALGQRLAGGALLTTDGAARSAAAKAFHGATFGNVVKLSLGVACVAAGAFVFARQDDQRPARPETTEFVAHAQPTSVSKPMGPSTESGPRETPTSSSALPSTHTMNGAPSRGAWRRPHTDSAGGHAETSTHSQQARSESSPRAEPLPAAKGATPDDGAPVRAAAAVSTATASTRGGLATQTEATPEKTAGPAAPEPAHDDKPDDARTELTLVERIHLAMRNGNPGGALALCAEHERRWPHGTFAQEREGVRAIASCEIRSNGAGPRARAFLAKYPGATLAPRVAAACTAQLAATAQGRAVSGAD